ncbi:uncharacterized protein LOC120652464 isoform X5 [Panicum virgatum]|uniref:uncharacterized protein LOC120652464 isoform X5 n=1 Tax=Panicum virgatum TaxID=38727 RepID=UPI0019D66BB9|nr:uncharacterized protein LOC120652464 isoform X5 [Panicum virgatum]
MDSKKKRNKKKKGNQGKNAADVMSKVGEAAPQHHNHESAPKDYYKDSDADDAMSSVEEGIPQYQNHEPTLQSDHNGTNAHVTTSSIGEGIPCYQDTEPTLTQGNHKASDAVPADQRSIGMSESSVELDMHRLYEAKLSTMESELEKLHSKVCFHAQNEVLLEEKLNSLQIGYDELIKKEEVLGKKVRCIDDINGTLTRQEALLKERLSELEETNKTLVAQVKVLEEASSNTSAENHTLVKKLDELDSRLQALEARAALSEALEKVKVSDSKAIDPMNFTSPLYQQTIGFTEAMSKGNELIAERGLSSSVELITDNSYRQINNTPSNAYASNHAQETAIQLPEIGTSNSIAQAHVDVNEHHRFDGPTSEEIVPVPLDDIQIHEDDLRQPGAEDEIDEVPFSDAPITGAPFRLISFVARYVSGADLVNKK